jgi:hypothetical protein
MTRLSPRFVAAALVFGLAASTARAGFIPWSYQWEASPPVVLSDSSRLHDIAQPFGAVVLLGQGHPKDASNHSEIVAVSLRTFSLASDGHPAIFTHAGYSLTVHLTDLASHQSGNLTFTGEFNGRLSRKHADIDNKFTGPRTQTLTLGNNLYTVHIGPFAPPGPPSSGGTGAISADVSAHPAGVTTPEPSTLFLMSLGALGLSVISWKKRRRVPRGIKLAY